MATNDTVKLPVSIFDLDEDNFRISEVRVDENDINMKIAVVVMLSVFSVVGVIGNAIAFYIFFGRRSLSTSVIFILALAGTDFFTCLVTIPYTIVFELLSYNLVYDLACKTYMFLITSTVPFSAYIMVGIALDRYFCICHPFWYVFTLRRAKVVIFSMGIPAVIFGIVTALSHGMYVYTWEIKKNSSNNHWERYHALDHIATADVDKLLSLTNFTYSSIRPNIAPYSQCVNNTFIFSKDFIEVYEKIHALNFLFAYISVAVLYILIYRSIFTRRVQKAKRRKSNLYPAVVKKQKNTVREETLMTAINGGHVTNPTAMNNETKKHAKHAPKITLTARNDPSIFRNPDSETEKCATLNTTKIRKRNGLNFITKYYNAGRNGTDKRVNRVVKFKTLVTACEQEVANENFDEENKNSVYIGPQINIEENSVYTGPHINQETYSVYTGPHTSHEEYSVYTGPHIKRDENSVYTGPHTSQVESSVYTGPQTSQDLNSVYTGPQTSQDLNSVYTGPQTSQEENRVYTSVHECFSSISDQLYIRPNYNQELDAKIATKNSSTKSHNQINKTVENIDKSENNDEDINTASHCVDGSAPEEKPLLSVNHQFQTASSNSLCVHSNISTRSLSLTEESQFVTSDKDRKHHSTDQSHRGTQTNSVKRKRPGTSRDGHLIANIKTALMLFIVTLVFIIAFLPALLMANDLIPLNLIGFYGYFIYNVVNPFIYAFMNQTFREDLKKIIKIC